MTQFAVFRSPNRKSDVPYVVAIQSARLSAGTDRVVMALMAIGYGAPPDHPLTPHLVVDGRHVYANPLNLATVPLSLLGGPVCVLAERDQERVFQAIDEMITRA